MPNTPSPPRRRASPDSPARRKILELGALTALWPLAAPSARADQAGPARVLRYALNKAETGFDPAQVNDVYSWELVGNIFDPPLRYDMLAQPLQLRPNTAAALPEMSADFRELTLRIRPGILFADDPAFRGRPRELVAADYAYSLRRHFDPRVQSAGYSDLQHDDILGLEALRDKAEASRAPFDYDTPVDGLQLLDRYTLRIRFGRPSPRFALKLAQTIYAGAVAREVVEAYGAAIMEHPVGTGPYRLVEWRRSSFMAFERNPHYREEVFDEHPAPGDADGLAIARRLQGRRLPMIDRVEVSVIEEAQPFWLAFYNGEFDLTWVPLEFTDLAVPGGRLAPSLARRGMQLRIQPRPDIYLSYFNMEDPVVGGYTPEKVALRRAIALAYSNEAEIRLLRHHMAIAPQGLIVPGVAGYDPTLRSAMSDYSPERARALLDLYGYLDRDGDGWRELPDGSPLVLHFATESDSTSRALNELWHKGMDAIGVRMVFERAQWPENFKQARAGKLQMWSMSASAGLPDLEDSLSNGYGPAKGENNCARFDLPAFNALYERLLVLSDGPERAAAAREAEKLLLAYMPYKAQAHRVRAWVSQPWLAGWPSNPFVYGWWRFLDIDPARRPPLR
jgi:ABC-type transport system substrate-binding protein